jgi:hypothetical protein
MLKKIMLASTLAMLSIGPAGAQSLATRQSSPGSTPPELVAAVQACEAQKHRMAGLNKTLAANFDVGRVHDECVATAREALAYK